jgi:hypothetical protein
MPGTQPRLQPLLLTVIAKINDKTAHAEWMIHRHKIRHYFSVEWDIAKKEIHKGVLTIRTPYAKDTRDIMRLKKPGQEPPLMKLKDVSANNTVYKGMVQSIAKVLTFDSAVEDALTSVQNMVEVPVPDFIPPKWHGTVGGYGYDAPLTMPTTPIEEAIKTMGTVNGTTKADVDDALSAEDEARIDRILNEPALPLKVSAAEAAAAIAGEILAEDSEWQRGYENGVKETMAILEQMRDAMIDLSKQHPDSINKRNNDTLRGFAKMLQEATDRAGHLIKGV